MGNNELKLNAVFLENLMLRIRQQIKTRKFLLLLCGIVGTNEYKLTFLTATCTSYNIYFAALLVHPSTKWAWN